MSHSAVSPSLSAGVKNPWIRSKRWDLVLLIGTAILIPLPLWLKNGFGWPIALIHLATTAFIGGPHLFATFTYTLMERRFWRKHPLYASGSLLIPPIVIYLGFVDLGLLIGLFIFWASIHVLHQICYLSDCYQAKQGPRVNRWARAIDYAVVLTSLYPIAAYRLVHGDFLVADTNLTIPFVRNNPPVFFLVCALFIVALVFYLGKTAWEWKTGRLSRPKTLLIGVGVLAAFFLPLPKDLDATFQGFNIWHSLQYLGIAWWINALRKEKGRIGSPFVQSISGRSKTKAVLFYISCLVPTIAFLGLIAVLTKATHQPLQCYFTVVLSGLLMHYYFDHWVFTKVSAVVPRSRNC